MITSVLRVLRKIYTSPEVLIYERIVEHSKTCVESVRMLKEAIHNYESSGYSRSLSEVYNYERKADGIRREILELLSKSGLPPVTRQDFIRLVERMDLIADYAKEVARILTILQGKKVDEVILDHMAKLSNAAFEASQTLHEAVSLLRRSYSESLNRVMRVEEIEDEGDTLYINALRALSEVEVRHSILLERAIEDLEMCIDACEDTSDVLEEIIIRFLR